METDHPLCPDCAKTGKCRFEQDSGEFAGLKLDPQKKLQAIALMRKDARDRKLCPKVNEVNPKIEGL